MLIMFFSYSAALCFVRASLEAVVTHTCDDSYYGPMHDFGFYLRASRIQRSSGSSAHLHDIDTQRCSSRSLQLHGIDMLHQLAFPIHLC